MQRPKNNCMFKGTSSFNRSAGHAALYHRRQRLRSDLGILSPNVWRVHFFIESIFTFDKYLAYYPNDTFDLIRLYLKLFWNVRAVDKAKNMQHAQRVKIDSFPSVQYTRLRHYYHTLLSFRIYFWEILNEKFNKP